MPKIGNSAKRRCNCQQYSISLPVKHPKHCFDLFLGVGCLPRQVSENIWWYFWGYRFSKLYPENLSDLLSKCLNSSTSDFLPVHAGILLLIFGNAAFPVYQNLTQNTRFSRIEILVYLGPQNEADKH